MSKSSKAVAVLKIDNCLDCPNSKEIRDPGSADSFDAHDVSLCCTLAPRTQGRMKTDLGEVIPGRFIIACERIIRRKDAAVPQWCPLLQKTEKVPEEQPEQSTPSTDKMLN